MKNAITVDNLGIFFSGTGGTMQEELIRFGKNAARKLRGHAMLGATDETKKWVFRNLTFDVKHGEVVGILGGNGSGKTTLLKILSRVLFPSEGRASIDGRVASLLAVGTGFNHAYSGQENVFLNGMILGLSREEIREKYDAIVEFADIGEAIDMPVKNYSTGMRARLAFAVAACLESDIVMLDEVLAVGDAGFRDKSLDVIRNMKREGKTIVLVSHSMSAIDSFCDRAMILRNGSIDAIGEPQNVIRTYLEGFKTAKKEQVALRDRIDRDGSGILRIVDYRLETPKGVTIYKPQAGHDVVISLKYETEERQPLRDVNVGVAFFSNQGYKLARFATDNLNSTFTTVPASGEFKLTIPRFPFAPGTYLIGFRIVASESVADSMPNAFEIEVEAGDFYGTGVNDDHSPMYVSHEWDLGSTNTDAASPSLEAQSSSGS